MTKLPQEASNKLINLLYSRIATKVTPQLPKLRNILYDEVSTVQNDKLSSSDVTPVQRVLQTLGPELMTLKDKEDALNRVRPKITSNILRLKCPNSYITRDDFSRILPMRREQTYVPIMTDGSSLSINAFEFLAVKERSNFDLSFQNAYYLIFANQLDACVYLEETRHRVLNGIRLNFQFAEITEDSLKRIVPETLYYGTKNYSALVGLCTSVKSNQYTSAPFQNYELLKNLVNFEHRRRSVLVRNMPPGLTHSSLTSELWNINLHYNKPITVVRNDSTTESSVYLLHFTSIASAENFVNRYHGRNWDNFPDRENGLHNPVLCEIIDA
ncbi:uncharacterized protein J8A68_004719 [[Candida] subhashii]|uniref:Uncharacterized protein n=1 Tax=[Candida] subhashii TaxID=561895 RepID=A0A8J5UK90_9ASCO|nr:uncharacterized protein J8A68_004719 [[Candida] subhashii]KAG7661771.1 hypothetical protein J8A68_004719 [[Candida] subhashii]